MLLVVQATGGAAMIRVYGAPWCPDCRRVKKFLTEHRARYDWVDVDQDTEARAEVQRLQDGGQTIPTVVFDDGAMMVNPSNHTIAAKLDLNLRAEREAYDLAIIGGGPAGLAAAIYAAREGIDTVVVDKGALGGQAGATQQIDNYPGFPDGVGGADLAARFVAQSRRYGVELLSAVEVEQLALDGQDVTVALSSGQQLCAGAVIVATGSSYRRLGLPGEDDLIGAGVHYCATCDGPFYHGAAELLVVGGGNSGLEEALFLSQFADRVRIVEHSSMLKGSTLLQTKIAEHPEFTVHTNTQITGLTAKAGKLYEVTALDAVTGEQLTWRPDAAFVYIGMDPNSAFLRQSLHLDKWGFVTTDDKLAASMPGVYAAGDVRAGSTKQLGAAVGEGITALIHARQYLQRRGMTRSLSVNA
ncbi:FAD-dependent oxidoreductase [Catellatospora sp. NPDC049111]|uniref:FAD-dependent oxidoreductase n=1 Tax=Catellatospora sp. NPDC049111 TaxID=3155271 RepID=UPI0033F919B2